MDFLKRSENPKSIYTSGADHLHLADFYKEELFFIKEGLKRDNIAYHLQYLEFNVYLYNNYDITYNIESLLCKNMLLTLAMIFEAILSDLLREKINTYNEVNNIDYRLRNREFTFEKLIGHGFRLDLIDLKSREKLEQLRRIRKNIHPNVPSEREYQAYSIEDVNRFINELNLFMEKLKKRFG